MNAIIGDNGIITRAQEAKKLSDRANDEEAVKLMIIESVMNDDDKMNIGKELFDRTVENGDKWNVIIEKETGEVYGTGWHFIPKGTLLKNGEKSSTNWLIDKKGNIEELLDDTFTELDFQSSIGVTDGLVFNMDATNIGDGLESWGKNVSLRYFNISTYNTSELRAEAFNEQKKYGSVLTKDDGYDRNKTENVNEYKDEENNSFKFSGNNYIEIYREDGFDFSKGMTFEFYGRVNSNLSSISDSPFCGTFGIWDGDFNSQPQFRFGLKFDYLKGIQYSLLNTFSGETGSLHAAESPWNQLAPLGIEQSKDYYITVVLTPSENEMSQKFFVNGQLTCSGTLTKDYYSAFENQLPELKYIDLGRCSMGSPGNWHYINGICYCTRLYNRGIEDSEVLKNYDCTLAYQSTLKK